MRKLLIALSQNSAARDVAVKLGPVRRTVDRFVAGETLDDAIAATKRLADAGLKVTIDHLGEYTTTQAEALATTDAYLALLERLGAEGLAPVAEVSVKASAIGLTLPRGAELAEENAGRICAAAAQIGTTVTVDMEDHTATDATLNLLEALRAEFPTTGGVLQAMLKRTPDDCRRFNGPGSRIRLCKGAYDEPATVAHRTRPEISESYLACLRILFKGEGYPMVASHDPAMISAALGYADLVGRAPGSFEFQMLYGIRPEEQKRLAAAGHTVRIYLPYGVDWYAYFMRRLGEKPANLALLGRALVSRN